ncbi:MAG TPA: FUSC family protein [Thermoplasmata archaeon]|nr:FUSC family protein [Thermoplasmata archaeon]
MTGQLPSLREVESAAEHVEREEVDLAGGIRAALVLLLPLGLGFLLHDLAAGILTTLGTLNLLLVDYPRLPTPKKVLAISVLTNAAAFTFGAVLSANPAEIAVPLVGVGVALSYVLGSRLRNYMLGVTTAVLLSVGVGLPIPTAAAAPVQGLYVLLGGAWGLFGAMIPRWIPGLMARSPPISSLTRASHVLPRPTTWAEELVFPATVGIAVAAGLWISLRLELVRDFWVMLTILVALRPDLTATLEFSTMRVAGTVLGAAAAFPITLFVTSAGVLLVILTAVAALMYALRTFNYVVYATAITIFVIVLLNISYPGSPGLAVVRVIDTGIGGAIGLAAGTLLWLFYQRRDAPRGGAAG